MKAYIGNRAIPRKVRYFYEFFCASRLSAIRFNPTGIFSAGYRKFGLKTPPLLGYPLVRSFLTKREET